jgi:hypothetical protein
MINPMTEPKAESGVSPRDISNVLSVGEAQRIKAQAEYDQAVANYRNAIELASKHRWTAGRATLVCMNR